MFQAKLRRANSIFTRVNKAWFSLLHPVTDEAVESWAAQTKIFFIVGMGRSGTTLLSELLDADHKAKVFHEPVRTDFAAYAEAFHNREKANEYVQLFRKKDIYIRASAGNQSISTYGEVNGMLRRHVSALRNAFPEARIIHLVRDGRDVVRSMMSRNTFTWLDPITAQLTPTIGDPMRNTWDRLSRFEKLCWYWQIDNEFARRLADATVHFEKIITDYDYFRSNLLRLLDLEVSKSMWKQVLARPINATRKHVMPRWPEWKDAEKRRFYDICGEEMHRSGYAFG